MFQFPEYQLFEETIEKDISFGPKNFGVSAEEAAQRAKEVLKVVGLDESYLQRSPFDLSGGQKRRIAIAGILAMNPDVLVLDEPTASLDTQAKERIHELLRTLKQQGVTVLLITHDRAEAEALADRVVRMPNAAEQPDSPASDALNNSNTEASVSNTTAASAGAAFSVIHRLDPRVKMVGFLAAMFTMFAVNTPVQHRCLVLHGGSSMVGTLLTPVKFRPRLAPD